MSDLSLVYVNPIGKNNKGLNEYEFLFSETPESVWGEKWELQYPSGCKNLKPREDTYSEVKRVITEVDFFCAQQNSCFSMQDCIDGCIALMWFTNNRDDFVVFKFGEGINSVVKKLSDNGIGLIDQNGE